MQGSRSDVSAVVLTLGERTMRDAIRAIEAQSLPAREIVIVDEQVTPFHRALNHGAARVRTPFFFQVDADMILDPICFAAFRDLVRPDTGIVSGFLRDPLLGRVCCVKMFRTECFAFHPMPDSISPDTDFRDAIRALGWKLLRALRFDDRPRGQWHTFGEHRRDYTPRYTFAKFLLEGRRALHRRDAAALRDRLTRLGRRHDEVSLIARIALAHGVFLEESGDLLRPFEDGAEWLLLEGFLGRNGGAGERRALSMNIDAEGAEVFRDAVRLGIELRRAHDRPAFLDAMRALAQSAERRAWIAEVGLCHGLFADRFDEPAIARRYELLRSMTG